MAEDKFLVRLVHGIGHKQAFFMVWAALGGFFVWLMVSHYRKVTRRNFRPGSANPTPARPMGKAVTTVESSKNLKVK